MKCPHCLESFHDFYEVIPVGNDADGNWGVVSRKCPSCERVVLVLVNGKIGSIGGRAMLESVKGERLIYPRTTSRVPLRGKQFHPFETDRDRVFFRICSPRVFRIDYIAFRHYNSPGN